jgi:hypothetical protein
MVLECTVSMWLFFFDSHTPGLLSHIWRAAGWHQSIVDRISLISCELNRIIIFNKYRPVINDTSYLMTSHLQIVSPYKDVEGLHFKFHYNLYHKYFSLYFFSVTRPYHFHPSIRYIKPSSLTSSVPHASDPADYTPEQPPHGTVKSILPCTPLAIVKCLEHVGVYNSLLPYGDRAYGKTVTVINRSTSFFMCVRCGL